MHIFAAIICAAISIVGFAVSHNAAAAANAAKNQEAFIKFSANAGYRVKTQCIDGILYLVTDAGGISPKFEGSVADGAKIIRCN